MTNEDKILVVDRIVDLLKSEFVEEDIPVKIGVLNTRIGIKGFVTALEGHPVFEHKDRYFIYLESVNPEKVSLPEKEVKFGFVNVKIPYYKHSLKPFIDYDTLH